MAVADADADHDDIIAHLRIIGQRQEVSRTQDARSWLRIDLSHNDVSVTSSSERLSATNCAIWYSIAAWFCAVGGTIVAARSGGTATRRAPRYAGARRDVDERPRRLLVLPFLGPKGRVRPAVGVQRSPAFGRTAPLPC